MLKAVKNFFLTNNPRLGEGSNSIYVQILCNNFQREEFMRLAPF